MRTVLITLAAAVFLGGPLVAAPRTVKGELVEIACVRNGHDSEGPEHRDCAVSCARGGAALGVMTDDGIIKIVGEYTENRNAKLLEFIAEEVEATGEMKVEDGELVIRVTAMKVVKR